MPSVMPEDHQIDHILIHLIEHVIWKFSEIDPPQAARGEMVAAGIPLTEASTESNSLQNAARIRSEISA